MDAGANRGVDLRSVDALVALVPIADWLEGRLRSLGRLAWAEEEFRKLEDIRFTVEPVDPEAFRRVRGARAGAGSSFRDRREPAPWRGPALPGRFAAHYARRRGLAGGRMAPRTAVSLISNG